MTIKSAIALAALFFATHAHAGWYVVDNYAGTLGSMPVHVSLQEYDSYGSGLTIKGSYYYDKYHAPIPLYGKRTSDRIELCEVHTSEEYEHALIEGTKAGFDTHACPFSLNVEGGDLRGEWRQGKKRYPVTLKNTGSLDNRTQEQITGQQIAIPFWGQTATHSFIGLYEQKADRIEINRIDVVNKKTGNVDQTLNPQQYRCDFGFFMTAIYQNIEADNHSDRVTLNYYSQKGDISVDYAFDRTLQQYRAVSVPPTN